MASQQVNIAPGGLPPPCPQRHVTMVTNDHSSSSNKAYVKQRNY